MGFALSFRRALYLGVGIVLFTAQCPRAHAGVFSDWDFNYELGLEIPTELNSLGALTRCKFGPLLSGYLRYEQQFKKSANDQRLDFYVPFRFALSPVASIYLGPGIGMKKFSAVAGAEVLPIDRALIRTEIYTGLGGADQRLVFSQAAEFILPSSGRRRDYVGLRFEIQREGAARDSRFLIATGSEF